MKTRRIITKFKNAYAIIDTKSDDVRVPFANVEQAKSFAKQRGWKTTVVNNDERK